MNLAYKKLDLAKAKQKAGKIEWYHQAGAVKPFYVGYPWYACSEFRLNGKVIKPYYETVILHHDHFMEVYFDKQSLLQVGRYYFTKQTQNKNFIRQLEQRWQKDYLQPLLKSVEYLQKTGLSDLALSQLIKVHQQLSWAYTRAWQEVIFLDAFDLYGDDFLKQILSTVKAEIAPQDLDELISPPRASWLQKERLSLLKIAERVKRQNGNNKSWLDKSLKEHSAQYHWLHNDYATVEKLTPAYFKKQVQRLASSPQLLVKEQELRRYLNGLQKHQQAIAEKYKLSQDQFKMINFFGTLGALRDERKTMTQIVDSLAYDFAVSFARLIGWDVNLVEHVFWWEVPTVFSNPGKYKNQISNRLKPFLTWLTKPADWQELSGKAAQELNAFIADTVKKRSKLQGMPAYPGLVKGKVRIVKTKADFHKMKRGNILVAPNTRPEYVPIMKIAGAIISDEGGLTCHSAIVSRELHIPCIVGMQSATTVLKDGELVEVDAGKGTVTQLRS